MTDKRRFSKRTVQMAIGHMQISLELQFEDLEGKPFDWRNGTAQATTPEGEARVFAWLQLENLLLDLGLEDWRGN